MDHPNPGLRSSMRQKRPISFPSPTTPTMATIVWWPPIRTDPLSATWRMSPSPIPTPPSTPSRFPLRRRWDRMSSCQWRHPDWELCPTSGTTATTTPSEPILTSFPSPTFNLPVPAIITW